MPRKDDNWGVPRERPQLKKVSLRVIGGKSAGKTSLINRYTEGSFNDKYKHTAETELTAVKKKIGKNEEVKAMIWETQG